MHGCKKKTVNAISDLCISKYEPDKLMERKVFFMNKNFYE